MRSDGDFHPSGPQAHALIDARRRLVDVPWTQLAQCHGIAVVEVRSGGDGDGSVGDIAVTSQANTAIGIWVGDCAAVALIAPSGRFALAHAGWRGLAGGIIDAALGALGECEGVVGYVGPSIGPCCYEFSPAELAMVAEGIGCDPEMIRSRDRAGRDALDLRAALEVSMGRHGVPLEVDASCTGCDTRYFSHRVRSEPQRHVIVAWREPGSP